MADGDDVDEDDDENLNAIIDQVENEGKSGQKIQVNAQDPVRYLIILKILY